MKKQKKKSPGENFIKFLRVGQILEIIAIILHL